MDARVRQTTTVLLGLAGGAALALLLLFVMVGGGFIAAVLVLGLLPLGFATVAMLQAVEAWAPRSLALPLALPQRTQQRVAQAIAAALAIALAIIAVMALVRGPAHALADLQTHAAYVLLTALGGGALLAMTRGVALRAIERYAAVTSSLGVLVAVIALLSCCLWAVAYAVPLLSLVVLALILHEAPVALAGLAVNAVGLLTLAALRREAPA